MNCRSLAALTLVVALLPIAVDARGGGGGGGGFRGGGGGMSRSPGGFDFHNDVPHAPPPGGTHSSTGPAGTSRTTNVSDSGGTYNRNTTATNGNYNRTSGGTANANGNYSHYSNGSSPYGTHSSSTSGNANTGNYSHTGSGSNAYGSYNTSGSGNTYNHTYSGSGTATNQYGQTYHSATYASNGVVYHGAAVVNPVYAHYPAWGWNAGVAWYAAPYYWGGGFWGPMAVGAAGAVLYGSLVYNNQTYTSYQVQSDSPGEKLLSNYHLTQTPCGPPNLVVIYGPNGSVICAIPNNIVAAGNYSVDSSTLSIVSEKS